MRPFAVSAAVVLAGSAVLFLKRKGWSAKRLAVLTLLVALLLCAWVLQEGRELPSPPALFPL